MARKVEESPRFPQTFPRNLQGLFAFTGDIVRQLVMVFQQYGFRLNRVLPKDGSEAMDKPLPLAQFTVATLPDATLWEGAIIYVSDEVGGSTIAFSDGTNFRRAQDRAIVS